MRRLISIGLALSLGSAMAASGEEAELAPLSTKTRLDVTSVRELALSIVEVGEPSADAPTRRPVKVEATNVSSDDWPRLGFLCSARVDDFSFSISGEHMAVVAGGEDVLIEGTYSSFDKGKVRAFAREMAHDKQVEAILKPDRIPGQVPTRFECQLRFPGEPNEIALLWRYERPIFIEGCDEQLDRDELLWSVLLGEGTTLRDAEIFVPESEWRETSFLTKEVRADQLFECAFRRSFAIRGLRSGKLLATYSKRTGLSAE